MHGKSHDAADAGRAGEAGAALAACTCLKLRQLSRRVSAFYDRHLQAAGLKTTQFSLLSQVIRLGPVHPGVLAERLQMDASTLTRNLRPLLATGLLGIGPGGDGRSRYVAVTRAGRIRFAAARREWQRAQRALHRQLGMSRVAGIHDAADAVLSRMPAHPAAIARRSR
jgi:DNA-binding MarR family transcriptional regulator